jgi:hypothetical protein
MNMKKNTVIVTAEVTTIQTGNADKFPNENDIRNLEGHMKIALDVDDVVITKTQLFEGTEE